MRISVRTRTELHKNAPVFVTSASESLEDLHKEANELSFAYNDLVNRMGTNRYISPAGLHMTAVLHLMYQTVLSSFLQTTNPVFFSRMSTVLKVNAASRYALTFYIKEFPSPLLEQSHPSRQEILEESLRGFFIHQVMTCNTALVKAAKPFISPDGVVFPPEAEAFRTLMLTASKEAGMVGYAHQQDIFAFLTEPARRFPDSLEDQISFILETWSDMLSEKLKMMLLKALSYAQEEHKPKFGGNGGGKPETTVPDYSELDSDYEKFTDDRNWMPNVVMIAKSTLVWLDQLSKAYGRPITHLDQIPDHELDLLKERGITALWLIGLWERSEASKEIKIRCGNPDAEASAYSLKNYKISASLGGWPALENLRNRCTVRGIRLASDMVPNHTGIDSDWVFAHPEYFIQQDYPPFSSYTYNGPNLSEDPNVEIRLEDHYYDQSDAAVTFMRKDNKTGKTTYIFHGNDGTSMPWNDTAQLDFLNPSTREAVFQEIRHVAQNFPIIRFDAAMTLAKKHIRRLWYPQLGSGGDIAGRAGASMSDAEFNARIPQEFWREVVDRMAKELPDTLLLAEAFWMMEGYFVRTLGMHRVYNSAFMNMLKNQENKKYRDTIKKTISFEPEILKRFVNFMNNPDEETAIAQFGDGDKYFGVFTLLATMPGLPMIGHGQIEGFREKYGMEYKRAYWDESPNQWLIAEHYRRIFPLLRKRYLYSGIENFQLFDVVNGYGATEESVFCYVNGNDTERSLVVYNNQFQSIEGTARISVPKLVKENGEKHTETVSVGQALNLLGGNGRFVIYGRFPSNLYYLKPSQQIFDHGISFHLEGYETQVFTDVHEINDTDGTFDELYRSLNGKGVWSIEEEIRFLRLRPFFTALDPLRGVPFFSICEKVLTGDSPEKLSRKLTLLIAECDENLSKTLVSLPQAIKTFLPDSFTKRDPDETQRRFGHLFRQFSETVDNGFFLHGAQTMKELPVVFGVALLIQPFLRDGMSVMDAMKVSDRLLCHRFYEDKLVSLDMGEVDARKICHLGAILAESGMQDPEETDPKRFLEALLADQSVYNYTGCNEYQDIVWYKKESLQECIFVSALSLLWHGRSIPEYQRVLMKAEEKAGYRLDGLLKG
jgi:glycosidase